MTVSLDSDVQFLKGVGQKKAELYAKLGIKTLRDLIYHFPRSYIDLRSTTDIDEAAIGSVCAVKATVARKSGEQRIRKGFSVFKVEAANQGGSLTLTFYNTKYTVDALKIGYEYIFYGKIGGTFIKKDMQSPAVFPPDLQGYYPIYPLTQGLSSKAIAQNVKTALALTNGQLEETLPDALREKYDLSQLGLAIASVHEPPDMQTLDLARRRLIFEELLTLSLAMSSLKSANRLTTPYLLEKCDMAPYFKSLPFTPTNAQLRCIEEGVNDMCRREPMNRLVQGDVGSGKTAVAAALCYMVFKNRCQSAVMAPTEILATQHYATFKGFLEPLGVNIALLTGSTPAGERRRVLASLAAGETHLLIGTHALISAGVDFTKLALVVTDEQHRFGVAQRATLAQKGHNPHLMVMSATPIPRTLALIIYGDLDISVIDELPPGKQHIDTMIIDSPKRDRAFGFIAKQLDAGLQAYIVCPLIEDEEDAMPQLKPAVDYFDSLSQGFFTNYRVGLLHGRMKNKQKDEIMRQFKQGEIQLLVSTTVVEVGVDVPNAVIMMIENAERFGLSQLHQLRGRVGRGKAKSYCILLSDTKNPETMERLKMMCQTNDGFKIAEFDLSQRGPGDFFGSRQHGLPVMMIANLLSDVELLRLAQACAERIVKSGALYNNSDYRALLRQTERMLSSVGERLN